jgi:hypothetical protein
MSSKLAQIRRFAERDELYCSSHALDSIQSGGLSLDDVRFALMTASVIFKRECDEEGDALDGYKYTIIGKAPGGLPIYTCGKIVEWVNGKTYFLITAHSEGD